MIFDKYYVEKVDNSIANPFQIPRHYLHTKINGSCTLGMMVEDTNELKGVIMYSPGNSTTLLKGICGEEEKVNAIVLSRLCIADDVEKNAASWLIAQSMKFVEKKIIISFADPSNGHLGGVYQASNFYYIGLTAKRTDVKVDGLNISNRGTTARYNTKELKAMGARVTRVDRIRKHRYLKFNCNKRQEKILLGKLNQKNYPITPYPKAINPKIYSSPIDIANLNKQYGVISP